MVWLIIGIALGIVIANLWLIRKARGPIIDKTTPRPPSKPWEEDED